MPLIDKDEAVIKLLQNEVVAIPTETVYGLAGLANSDLALKKIFSIKDRPFFDPLILHVQNTEQAQKFATFDAMSLLLANSFWPAPLTIVLPKKETVTDLITSGGSTVALRSPDHKIFQDILSKLPAPLAAPSANMFGRTSPTSSSHVIDEFSDLVMVVDGGPCKKGIESTVVQYSDKEKKLFILRSGVISQSTLQNFFNTRAISIRVEHKFQSNTPGHLKNHYQPTSIFFLVQGFPDSTLPAEALNLMAQKYSLSIAPWVLPSSASHAARKLYSDLREFSKNKQACYFIVPPLWQKSDQWQGLLDRLQKAAHFFVIFSHKKWSIISKG